MRQTARIDALLVHSPLVGPMTMEPLASELRRQGWRVDVPDLRGALRAPRPQWRAIVDLAISGSMRPDIVVGHSGAGVLLPLLADALDPMFVAYVDAVVPEGEMHEPGAEFLELIDSLDVHEGMLPPWHEWWPQDVLDRLVPDVTLRARIKADTPQVPRSFYDDAVRLPTRWCERPGCVMLQLSAGYDEFRRRAEAYGWPIDAVDGHHLDVATRPALVRERLLRLIARNSAR